MLPADVWHKHFLAGTHTHSCGITLKEKIGRTLLDTISTLKQLYSGVIQLRSYQVIILHTIQEYVI